REDEVHAAAVQVQRLPEYLHGHGGALEMPAGTPASEGRIPGRTDSLVFRLRRLPEGEVLRVLLRIVVLGHASARPDLPRIQARQLPIIRESSDGEIHGAVLRLVGDTRIEQALNELDHL